MVVPAGAAMPTYAQLYRFTNRPDGAYPNSALIDVNGVFYGTTAAGGAAPYGDGTLYKVTKAGSEQVFYRFLSDPDGAGPTNLLYADGALFGTTEAGGENPGTLFRSTLAGSELPVYDFQSGTDGVEPLGTLIASNGVFYGTTEFGGGNTYEGIVFAVTSGGAETVLHTFGTGTDGALPQAGLVDVNGELYGTTSQGGTNGAGTVFKISKSGKEVVLHNFSGSPKDGSYPVAALINVNGTLYGTTEFGGAYGAQYAGYGTIYKISPTGTESVVYSFKGYPDGQSPVAPLTNVGGVLYGTTGGGGQYIGGTAFMLSGANETVVHSFGSGADGADPRAGLLYDGGVLYGTTYSGGGTGGGDGVCPDIGCGTIFKITL